MTRTDQWIKSYLSEEESLNEGLGKKIELKMLEPFLRKELEKVTNKKDLLGTLDDMDKSNKAVTNRKKWESKAYPETKELINSGKIKNGWELMKHLTKY